MARTFIVISKGSKELEAAVVAVAIIADVVIVDLIVASLSSNYSALFSYSY